LERKLRIAVAGAGFGEKYLTGMKAIPEVEVVGVYSRRAERAEEVAEKFEIPYSTRHFHVLLDLPGLDAVAVVTPNSTHAEFVRMALQARKHVICDKPLALNGGEAADLHRLAERVGVKHITFVPYRFSPASMAMRQAMVEGQIGRVLKVRASWGVDLRSEPLRWRFQSKLSGPGVVSDLGAHILDLVTWWVAPVRRVLGRCRTLVPERPAEAGGRLRPVDVPDECWSLVEFAEAGVGSVALSWNEKRDQKIEIEGERGTLIYQSPSLLQWLDGKGSFQPSATLRRRSAPLAGADRPPGGGSAAAAVHPEESGRTTILPMPSVREFSTPDVALTHMFREIVSYLRGDEKADPIATFRDGAAVLEVIDAMVASNETGRWLDVKSPDSP
jgi:predicted dehydrogenase